MRWMRSTRALLLCLIIAGAWIALADRHLPLVRNSLVYASASRHVIEHSYDPRPVVADSTLSYDKPILFAWWCAPLVRCFRAGPLALSRRAAGVASYP